MPLTTIQEIESVNNLSQRLAERVFEFQIEAEELLYDWISETKYNEIEADTSHIYYARLKRAETMLCYYFALPTLNQRQSQDGGLLRQVGISEATNVIMSTRELNSAARSVQSRARRLIRDLIVSQRDRNRPLYYTTLD